MNKKNKKYLIYSVVFVIVAGILSACIYFNAGKSEYVFSTTIVEKGAISNTITATGTLEATNTVVVGTQVSGVIEKLYVDFNSVVKKGQLIAELDKSTLQSSLENAEADLERSEANFEYQESCLERNKVLYDKDLLAKSVLFNYKTSKAEVKSAKANLERAQRNLAYASIYSPIDGVVLNRAVEEGQTVAASMNTPELFTIVNDLSTMQVEADIDEADIGMVKTDQRVEFTVDAFSNETFQGKISEVRLQPSESQNVITYTVIVEFENPDLKLKPGMTASITSYIEEANDVLLLAGKATRFNPDRQLLEDYMSQFSSHEATKRPNLSDNENATRPSGRQEELDDSKKVVWVKNDNHIHPVVIEVGIDDGSNMQVISGLEEGDVIVTSLELIGGSDLARAKSENNDEQKSPFVQERPGRKGGGPPR